MDAPLVASLLAGRHLPPLLGVTEMWQYALKTLITAVVVVAVAEIAKRNSLWSAVIASIPMTSLLAFVWLYLDTSNNALVAQLSTSIFWLVLPSLVLFVSLPLFLRANIAFWPSLGASCAATVAAYFAMLWLLGKFNVRL